MHDLDEKRKPWVPGSPPQGAGPQAPALVRSVSRPSFGRGLSSGAFLSLLRGGGAVTLTRTSARSALSSRGRNGASYVPPPPQSAPPATWLSQLLATNRTAAWLSDQASYFTLTGDDVDAWLEAGGDTNLDLSYVATEYKAKRDTTYPVNTSTATVRDLGFFLSRYQAGSAGKSSRIWPGGVGSYFVVVKINGAVSDGAWGSNDGIIRHGDTTAWGGILQIAGRMAGGGYRVRHTWWDGAIKTVDYNVDGTVLSGWHLISFRADGASISLEVDDLGEVSAPAGAMTYVDGVLRVMSPYSTGQDVAIAAIVAYSAFDDTTRNTVKAQLQSLITNLP